MNQNYGYPTGNTPNMPDDQEMKKLCMQYMDYHVITQMSDGTQMEGILEDVDDEGVTMLVPEVVEADDRQYGYGGYGRRRFRRYRRRRFPFFSFGFPFIFPFPFYY